MRQLRTLTALAATASLALAAAPGAFAKTAGVGNANGTPNLNICLAQIKCTYFNTKNGKPTNCSGSPSVSVSPRLSVP